MELLRGHRVATAGVLLIAAALNLAALAPLPWNPPLDNLVSDVQFKVRGPRALPSEFVLIYIGPAELAALGDWPITRDYYGYMIHVLSQLGAAAIGIDVLFSAPDRRYPEYDAMMADFMQAAGTVCLPYVFNSFDASHRPAQGGDPVWPIQPLRSRAAASGFANLGEAAVLRTLPIVARSGDSLALSFGAALARSYASRCGNKVAARLTPEALLAGPGPALRLNHFGDLTHVRAFSFLEVLQRYQEQQDVPDFSGKLVLIATTAPGLPILKATPLAPALPAAVLHLTLAENLLHGTNLRPLPKLVQAALIMALALITLLIARTLPLRLWLAVLAPALLVYLIVAQLAFSLASQLWPVAYPAAAGVLSLLFLYVHHEKARRSQATSREAELEALLNTRQQQLAAAQSAQAALQSRLARAKHLQEAAEEEMSQQLAAQKARVLSLEKQVRDLAAFTAPEPESPAAEFSDIIHAPGGRMAEILALVRKVAADPIPVLLLGETGTGKELIARAIHQAGPRRDAAFIAVNCGALSESLLESELFGHEKGSFTGSQAQRKGRFELADHGTLFLDEISETSPAFQARLLRVLQEGTFERVGGEATLSVDVRIIAASSANLQAEVGRGCFREDLFYRLNGFPITLPPLRDRLSDIPLLAQHFLKKYQYTGIAGYSNQAMALLQSYGWPGNVRELENVVRRGAILARGAGRNLIQEADLPEELQGGRPPASAAPSFLPLEQQILASLRAFKFGHSAISRTARRLGNKDRGTITEHFRGLCFQCLVENAFDMQRAAFALAGSPEAGIVNRVRGKIEAYLQTLPEISEDVQDAEALRRLPAFKGLPQKFHPYLLQILQHRSRRV